MRQDVKGDLGRDAKPVKAQSQQLLTGAVVEALRGLLSSPLQLQAGEHNSDFMSSI